MSEKANEDLLLSILSQPTAPFREGHVIARIRAALDAGKVPYFADPAGNLVLGARSQKEYLRLVREKTREPLRIFVAHMDHPGFHGAQWKSDTELEVRWHGGTPTRHLEGARVWLADRKGSAGHAKIASAKLLESGRAIESATLETSPDTRAAYPDPSGLFGGFAFRAPVWQDGELIYTKAADDLVGCFALVETAIRLRKKKNLPFLALLTRAEEVGFIGAIAHFEMGWLKSARRPLLGISLETSRALPGAEIGKGPVVRLGDRTTVFDSSALNVFSGLARELLPERHQRRIMDGGSCEATAMTAFGIPCIGISVPLGNYHNQSFEGGPDSAGELGPAPELVHRGDVEGLLALCQALLKPRLPWDAPWDARRKVLRKELKRYGPLLRSSP